MITLSDLGFLFEIKGKETRSPVGLQGFKVTLWETNGPHVFELMIFYIQRVHFSRDYKD